MPSALEKGMDGTVEEVGSNSSSPQMKKSTFGSKLKAHYKRFWWLHLIIFIAVTLILVLCLIYAAYPHIAQDNMNKSTLTVTALALSNPTPKSFHLFQNSTIGNPSSYHPQLDAFNASLSLNGGKSYGIVTLPPVHATKEAFTLVDQDVAIADMEAFTAYSAAVLGSDQVKLDVKGRTALHEMRFPTAHVDYHKTATMAGLDKLSGFNVTSFSIKLKPDPDGTNMVGNVSIPNPTVMTITMGNLTFNNILPGNPPTPLGISHIDNVVLAPGPNLVPMRSTVDQSLVLKAIGNKYKDGMLPVIITGNSSVYEGEHLPYFEKPLQALVQNVTLDVGTALKALGLGAKELAKLGGGIPL